MLWVQISKSVWVKLDRRRRSQPYSSYSGEALSKLCRLSASRKPDSFTIITCGRLIMRDHMTVARELQPSLSWFKTGFPAILPFQVLQDDYSLHLWNVLRLLFRKHNPKQRPAMAKTGQRKAREPKPSRQSCRSLATAPSISAYCTGRKRMSTRREEPEHQW